MSVDNSKLFRELFVPATDDGDTFVYTEILDRTKHAGNNGARLLRTFFHRSCEDFDRHMPVIRGLCEHAGARAYARPAARSFRKVGAEFTRMVVEASLAGNWAGMKTLYNSACGKTAPIERLFTFDFDEDNDLTRAFAQTLAPHLITIVPSRRAFHIITRPHQPTQGVPGVTLLRDHPTNLYIPDGAA